MASTGHIAARRQVPHSTHGLRSMARISFPRVVFSAVVRIASTGQYGMQ